MPGADGGEFNSWTAMIGEDDICFQFMSRSNAFNNGYNYQYPRCFGRNLFRDLPRDSMGSFTLTRAAGTMTFKGIFEGSNGMGVFSLIPGSAFVNGLKSAGYGTYEGKELLVLFIGGVNDEYLAYLKAQGYSPNHEELLQIAAYYDGLAELRNRLAAFERLGFDQPSLELLGELQIFGVDEKYVEEMVAAGFRDLPLRDMRFARAQGITGAFVAEMEEAGFRDLSFEQLQQLVINRVSKAYVEELRGLGYKSLSPEEVVNAKIHGVNTKWAAAFRELGFRDIPFEELLQLKIHGVTANFIKDRLKAGRSLKDYIKMKIQGL